MQLMLKIKSKKLMLFKKINQALEQQTFGTELKQKSNKKFRSDDLNVRLVV